MWGNKMIDNFSMPKCKVVAELGNIHLGKMDRAKYLIDLAVLCKADYVKFQKRNPIESVPKELQNKPHPNPKFSYGETYLQHRINLELNIDQHAELKDYCEKVHIKYATSVWDVTSAREVIQLNPEYIKVPSACNMNFELLEFLLNEYDGDIHLSTGMISDDEKMHLYCQIGSQFHKRIVLYHCTSEYPVPFERLYLMEIQRMKEMNLFKEVGFSNHGFGISSDIAAYTLGATWIERHFTDDRTLPHSDAAASLEPEGLRKLCRDLSAVQKSMAYKDGTITAEEQQQRSKLRGC